MTRTRWGAWSFDRRDDEIADLSWEDTVVLRSIRAVVRDRNWSTGAMTIERVDAGPDTLVLHIACTDLGADIRGTVRVEAEGTELSVAFDALSCTAFATNRTGLVVLQPHRLAGAPLEVVHSDGTTSQTAFPRAVSPHQPVLDIRALRWTDDPLDVAVDFHGDTFEMEDQRNWTDASYKTYSRPLSLPFPYDLAAGARIFQRVTVTATSRPGAARADAAGAMGATEIVLRQGGVFPAIELGAASAPDPAPEFLAIGDTVHVELDLASTNWRAALARAASTRLPLDARLIVPAADDAQWGTAVPGGITGAQLATALSDALDALHPLPVRRIAVFDPITHTTEPAATVALRAALQARGRTVPVIEGARSHFTELNREQDRVVTDADGVTFALTPLFHAQGDEQLHESIAVQRVLAEQAVHISGGRPVHIGPITLLPRFNNVATEREPGPTSADLGDGYGARFTGGADRRQGSDALAAWTVASAAALAVPGVTGLTYFEQWGPRGVVAATGEELLAATALRALAALTGGELLTGPSPDGLVWAVGSRVDESTTLLVANIDARERSIIVRFPGADGIRLAVPGRSFVRLAPTD